MKKIEVGDYVRVIPYRGNCWNNDGHMDKYCNTIQVVKSHNEIGFITLEGCTSGDTFKYEIHWVFTEDDFVENYGKNNPNSHKIDSANQYQSLALRTANVELKDQWLINGIFGLFGEGGELSDIVKKHKFQGHELNRENCIDELSDVCWYVALIASALDVELADVFGHNIEKLKKRYPDGFSVEKSIHREE